MPEQDIISKQEENDLITQALSLAKELKAEENIIGELTDERERNVKHFIKEDYTFEAAIYPAPVHYLEGGKWQDIDNTLVDNKDDDNTDVFENKKNSFKVKFAKKANKNILVKITKDKYEIVFGVDKKNKKAIEAASELTSQAEVAPKNKAVQYNLSDNDMKQYLPNISSEVIYTDIFENIDLKYIISSTEIKENIVIKQKLDDYVFSFSLSTKGLIPKLQQDNSIVFYDSNESSNIIYRIKPPIMNDSHGEISSNIGVSLIEDNKSYKIELQPDAQWVNSNERSMPITIDPTVETSIDIKEIEDSFVAEGNPTKGYYLEPNLRVGYDSIYKRTKSYLRFKLPTLKTSDLVVKAQFYASLQRANYTSTQINVHKVTGAWSSTSINWSNAPTYGAAEDYRIVQGPYGSWFSWDVTNIVKDIYNSGSNNGLVLTSNDEYAAYQSFLSSEYSQDVNAPGRPKIQIAYVSNTGLESYWTYRAQSIGRAGTGYVRDYNGNLTFIHDDLVMTGNRMPINLKHVYNHNDTEFSKVFGPGWRLNLSQRVSELNLSDGTRFMLVDEDTTIHYFKADTDGIYKDESGLGLSITKNGDGTYTIRDKKDNEMNFTTSGYLKSLKDSNGNELALNYEGNVLKSITDGAGRATTLQYYSSGYLWQIKDPSSRITRFDYNAALQLMSITYPDGKKSTYNYDSANKLTSVVNNDGYTIMYGYYAGITGRVSRIYETHIDGTQGAELNIKYGYNSTTYTDHRARTNIYQFNNYGHTTGIIDNEGRAQYYQYIREEGSSSNRNKLALESRLQGTVINYIKEHNVETTYYWRVDFIGSSIGSCTASSEEKFVGNQSLKIVKTNNIDRHYFAQTVTLARGKLYTLSCYIKPVGVSNTKNKGASVYIAYEYKQGQWVTVESNYINGTQDWRRYEVSFTLPADSYSDKVSASVSLYNETGTAYFDCFQLEEGATATRYNLVENAALLYGEPIPEFWQVNGYTDANDKMVTESGGFYPKSLGNRSFRMNGTAIGQKALYQNINVSGVKDEILVIGGWGKGQSVQTEGFIFRKFGLSIGFIPSVGEIIWRETSFNIDATDWQYAANRIAAPIDFVQIRYYVMYYENANTAYFTGLQLYKEEFGTSFGYDENGNIKTATEITNQESQFTFDEKNDLIKYIDPQGYNYTYEYDKGDKTIKKHNLTKAVSGANVVYSFQYDPYGNPTQAIVGEEGAMFIKTSATYYANNNYLETITDSLGNTVRYGHQLLKGTLDRVTDPKGNITTYSYEDNIDRLDNVSKSADGKEVINSYIYEKDRIKTVTHNGFSYEFLYSSLGDIKEVRVGTQTLVENTYFDRRNLIKDIVYGNGNSIYQDYDELDRLILRKFNGIERHRYQYDAYGNLNYHEDLVNNLQYRYSYDLADRLIKAAISNGDSVTYGYDKNNNITIVLDTVSGMSFSTNYNYTGDNKIDIVRYFRMKETSIDFNYDPLGRLKDRTISVGAAIFKASYLYKAGVNGSSSNKLETLNNNGSIITYDYDANGNIRQIVQSNGTVVYLYNELNELIRENNGITNKTIVYTYDVGGNILSVDEYDFTTGTTLLNKRNISTFGYTDNNWNDKLTSVNGKVVVSDAIGNIISYNGYNYTWEEGRQLKSITGPGVNSSFKYNDSGIRTQKDSNGVVTKYRLVGNRVTFEDNGTNRLYYTYDSRGNLVSMSIIRPANLLEASSDIGIFKTPSQRSGADIVEVTNPRTENTENKVKAIRLNKGAALPNIWSPLIGLKPNANYVLEFDYWADADNVKFDMDLFPDMLPQTFAIAKTSLQTYRWEFSSASEYMTTSNLRLFSAQTSTNPANIYITNLRLFETNKTADNILGGATAIGMMAAGNLSGVSAVDVSHPHTGNSIRVLRLNAGIATPIAWSPQMGLKRNTEYIVEFDYWSDSDNVRFNVDMFPDDLPEVNPIANKNVQHYKWRVNSISNSMSGAFLRFFNGVTATNPANIYITNIKLYEASKVPETGKEYYYIRNGQGVIIALIDDAGTQVTSYSYNSWGKLITLSGELAESVGVINPYRYKGYSYDAETKLYYLQSRYYNPEWCRFINADAIAGQVGELLSHNLFAYVKNNPINIKDSTGFRPQYTLDEETNEMIEASLDVMVRREQDSRITNQIKSQTKANQYLNAVVTNTAEELKGNKAKITAQSVVIVTAASMTIGKLYKVKRSDYVDNGANIKRLRIIATGVIGTKAAIEVVGDFFDSTATRIFLDLEGIFDKHFYGDEIDIFIDKKVDQIRNFISK